MKTLTLILLLTFPLLCTAQEVEWISFVEAVQRNQENPKKFFIDVYTDWCGWCKKMDANTFTHPVIAKMLKENFHAVKMDAEMKETLVFNGDTMKYLGNVGRRGTHELALRLMNGRAAYPTVVYLDENLGMIKPDPGYKNAEKLEPLLKFYGEDIYKEKDWETFLAEFESGISSEGAN